MLKMNFDHSVRCGTTKTDSNVLLRTQKHILSSYVWELCQINVCIKMSTMDQSIFVCCEENRLFKLQFLSFACFGKGSRMFY
jgi:hypothetical protein